MVTNNDIVKSLLSVPPTSDEIGPLRADVDVSRVFSYHTQDHQVRVGVRDLGVALVDYRDRVATITWSNLAPKDQEVVRALVERRGSWLDAFPTISEMVSTFLSA